MVNVKDIPMEDGTIDKDGVFHPTVKYTDVIDMLEALFVNQLELMKKYHEIEERVLPCIVPDDVPVNLDSYEGQHCLRWLIRNAITELSEADDCLKNKAWKKTMIETDVVHLKEEMVDALHFFIEACILIGMDAKELFEFYMKKNAVNKFRQRSEY